MIVAVVVVLALISGIVIAVVLHRRKKKNDASSREAVAFDNPACVYPFNRLLVASSFCVCVLL